MPRTPLTTRLSLWLGAALALGSGVIHLLEVQDGFNDAAYEGVLFIAMFVAAVAVATALLRGAHNGWLLGAPVLGGAALAYLASRTVGLPAVPRQSFCALGIISLALEALFIAVAAAALRASGGLRDGELSAAA